MASAEENLTELLNLMESHSLQHGEKSIKFQIDQFIEVKGNAMKNLYSSTFPMIVNSVLIEEDLKNRKLSLVDEAVVKKIEKYEKYSDRPLNLDF